MWRFPGGSEECQVFILISLFLCWFHEKERLGGGGLHNHDFHGRLSTLSRRSFTRSRACSKVSTTPSRRETGNLTSPTVGTTMPGKLTASWPSVTLGRSFAARMQHDE